MKYYEGDSFIALPPNMKLGEHNAHVGTWRAHQARVYLGPKYCLHNTRPPQTLRKPK